MFAGEKKLKNGYPYNQQTSFFLRLARNLKKLKQFQIDMYFFSSSIEIRVKWDERNESKNWMLCSELFWKIDIREATRLQCL